MPNTVPYPDINGTKYTIASVRFTFAKFSGSAFQICGIKSLNYSEKVEPNDQYGTGQAMTGTGAGKYTADGDVEIYVADANALITVMGPNWGNTPLVVNVLWQETGQVPNAVKMIVTLSGRTDSVSEGGELPTAKFTLHHRTPIETNGITMVPPIPTIVQALV